MVRFAPQRTKTLPLIAGQQSRQPAESRPAPTAIAGAGQPPIPAAEERHQGGDQDEPHQRGVDENRGHEGESGLLSSGTREANSPQKMITMMVAASRIGRPVRPSAVAMARLLSPVT
jgi:hypothetical protein